MSCIFNKGCQGFWSIALARWPWNCGAFRSWEAVPLDTWTVSTPPSGMIRGCTTLYINILVLIGDDHDIHELGVPRCTNSWSDFPRNGVQKWGHLPILGGYTEESHDAGTREPIPLVSSFGEKTSSNFDDVCEKTSIELGDFTIKTWKTYGCASGEAASRCGGAFWRCNGVCFFFPMRITWKWYVIVSNDY